jgi:L-2-hydroxyglutarate oxidase LhgO
MTPPQLIPFALAALRLHHELTAELTELNRAHYRLSPVQRLHLAFHEQECAELTAVAQLFQQTDGFSATELSGAEVLQREPRLSNDVLAGIVTQGNFSLDSLEFMQSLRQAAQYLGCRFISTLLYFMSLWY